MSTIEIRPADKFPEPAFSRLSRLVFADVQQTSAAFEAVLREEGAGPPADHQGQPPIVRFGAYDGDDLVGWSSGWMERGGIYYMANSGVLPDRRRQGIYARLLEVVRGHAVSQGALAIRSQHTVLNNPVIIAKLRAGFHVSGLSHSPRMGTLVELSLFLTPGRLDLFRTRTLPYAEPEGPAPAG